MKMMRLKLFYDDSMQQRRIEDEIVNEKKRRDPREE